MSDKSISVTAPMQIFDEELRTRKDHFLSHWKRKCDRYGVILSITSTALNPISGIINGEDMRPELII